MYASKQRLVQARKKAEELLNQMTLTEKIGQLSQFGTSIYEGEVSYYEDHYAEGKIGSYLSINGAKLTNSIQKRAMAEIPHHIPVLFGEDVIHGYRTTFPIPLAQSCSWDPEIVRRCCEISAKEAYCSGVKWVFSPMVDIALDPRWGRICEGYGEDPYLCSRMSEAAVKGYQGNEIGEKYRVISCLKHFAAYGACIGGRDYNAADISLQTLYETYLPSFKAGVDAGSTTLMSGFHSLNGVPTTANKMLLKKILREEWGFDGFVVSDCSSVANLVPHGYSENIKEAAFDAFTSGVDMNMAEETYNEPMPELVREGRISESEIDDSVLKILTVKYLLGLFDDPLVDETKEACYFCDEHLAAAQQAAEECIVLLKNKNNILPLDRNSKKIAIIGPFSDDCKAVLGSWDCCSDFEKTVTILDGIKEICGEEISTVHGVGCSANPDGENDTALLDEAIRIISASDVTVLVIGESQEESGEAKSKASLRLNQNQERLWNEAYATGKPLIILVTAGRPLVFGEFANKADAIVWLWQLGTMTGSAVARILFGECDPGGRLTVTFPATEGQIPINYNPTNTGHPPLGLYWYETKYIDAPIEPAYCFGYGLSYTKFMLSDLWLSSEAIPADGTLDVTCTVKNIGARAGKTVVQLYIRDLVAKCVRPIRQLKGFQKVALCTGEQKTVSFSLNAQDLGYYNSDLQYTVEPGKFELYIGQNCIDRTLESTFRIV